jgi:myo-inositol-1(or 4)-monophosphatase
MTKVDDGMIGFANRLADAGGAVIKPYFRQPLDITNKQGQHAFDPVTEADRGAERAMRDLIAKERPDDAILGEEFGETPGRNSLRWVLDPLDGTRAFITGRHEWGQLIALEDKGQPVLGILDQPVLGERFIGANGAAHLIQDGRTRPLKTRACSDLSEAVLCATDPSAYMSPDQQAAFARVKDRARLTRYGGDCYIFAAMALGFVDVIIEAGFKAWDVAALIPLVEGAGGLITDWNGGPATSGKTILAVGDKRLHAAAMALLSR